MNDNDELIRQRAYELWDRDGRPDGRDTEFWLKAEGEMSPGAGAASSSLTALQPSHITEHMQVISADHKVVGKVDAMEGADTIKLTKESSPGGENHHFIPTAWVDHVDQHVHLNKNGSDVLAHWKLEPGGAHFPNFGD